MTGNPTSPEIPPEREPILGGLEFKDLDKNLQKYENEPTLQNLVRVLHTVLENGAVNLADSVKDSTTVGDNLDSLMFNARETVRNLFVNLLRSKAKGASETTAGILAAMLAGCDFETIQSTLDISQLLCAQHAMELVPDDPVLADFSIPDRIKFYQFLIDKQKRTAIDKDSDYLLKEGEIYQIDPSLEKYKYVVASAVDRMLSEKLSIFKGATRLFGIRLDAFGDINKVKPEDRSKLVKLEDLFQMQLNSLRNLFLYIENNKTDKTERVGNNMLKALWKRYDGVEEEMTTGGYNSREPNDDGLEESLNQRENTIMIKLTVGGLAFAMANKKEHIANYLNDEANFETFERAAKIATRLIGISNDLGSYILRSDKKQISEFFESITLNYPEVKTLREAIAPENFRKIANADEDLATDGMPRLRAIYDVESLEEAKNLSKDAYNNRVEERTAFWQNYLQLLKDATKGEGNLLLDFALNAYVAEDDGVPVINKQYELAKHIVEISQNMELELGKILADPNMPEELKVMFRNMVTYHMEIYLKGDYYGKNNVQMVASLPTIKGEKNNANWRLYSEE